MHKMITCLLYTSFQPLPMYATYAASKAYEMCIRDSAEEARVGILPGRLVDALAARAECAGQAGDPFSDCLLYTSRCV